MSAVEELVSRARSRFDEASFLDFLDERSDDGHWELIEGIPFMMPPPSMRHRAIAKNLERLLNAALRAAQLPLEADREVPLRHPTDTSFRPEADVVVIDPDEEVARPTDRFYETCRLVAEVLSPSTEHVDLVTKRQRYTELPECQHIVILSQNEMRLRHWARSCGWAERVYMDPEAVFDLPEFSFSCRLKDLYARTDLL
ncbi:Uma2 family endonuclease [Fulvimarina sp. MAC3]|uniref:Uma2 family endonuclease n=1 Tax=Fulvimarina sp. MAC3 TaxID=3148887 RepID=UPI0031FC323D